MKRALLPLVLALAGLAAPAAAQVGSVLRSLRIKPGVSGFVGPLAEYDYFGSALAALGDLNGDGVGDLAVGAQYDDDGGLDRGAIWILFLKPDGTVLAEQKISQTQGGFGGTLSDQDWFGRKLASVGDLDGDGLPELATVTSAPNRLWVLFLNANGTAKGHTEVLYTDPAFVPATLPEHFFYASLEALGDLDGDGLGDLAVGSPKDPDGAHEAGAVWILRLRADGGIQAAHKISQLHGGFTGTLQEDGYFGIALVHLGDLDGDGNRELGVLSPYSPPFGGTFWVLYLDSAEQVASQREFHELDYGLAWPGGRGAYPTWYLGWLGDIDGNGTGELALGFPYEDFPGDRDGRGVIAIGTPRADGSVPKKVRIGNEHGGFGLLPRGSGFGRALESLGDLDGDGAHELAVGIPSERTGTLHTGGLWILSLDPSAVRNGSGANPLTLSQASEPVFGTSWTATLDCSGHAPGAALLFGFDRPAAGAFSGFGEVLVTGTRFFLLQAAHGGAPVQLSTAVPPVSVALLDLPIFVQGACTGAPGTRLSNALDVLVGR
jgi:hypothetical protein